MTRNKELYLPIALSMALTLVSGLLCGFLGGPWAALTGSGSVLLTTLLWMSTTWSRYKKLQELGEYLASVYAGGELLDIRDNREGELSLLKNDLHKITVTLRQQSAQLAHDKEFLQQLLGNISHQLRTCLLYTYRNAGYGGLAGTIRPTAGKAPGIYRAAYCTAGTNAMVTGETFDLVPVGCRVPGTGTKNRFTAIFAG